MAFRIYSIQNDITSKSIKKDYLMRQIIQTNITDTVLIDAHIYSDKLRLIFTSDLSAFDISVLNPLVQNHTPSSDPYPIYTEEYYVKISESDQQANVLSSSLISSNTITYSILNRGSDEFYRAAVADPLTLNNLTLTSDLAVNYIHGINNTDVNITSFLQYHNRGIILNSSIPVIAQPQTNTILKWSNPVLINNGMTYTGSDIRADVPGFYYLELQSSGFANTANSGRGLKIFKNNLTSLPIVESFGRYETGGTSFVINISGMDYNSSSSIYIPCCFHDLGGMSTCIFNNTDAARNIFSCVYLGN